VDLRGPTFKRREGKGKRGGEKKEKEGKEKGRARSTPQAKILATALAAITTHHCSCI